MNDTLSLFLATLVLATGGLGLYMYKDKMINEDDELEEVYNETTLFSLDEEEKTKNTDQKKEEVVENNSVIKKKNEIIEQKDEIIKNDKLKPTKNKKGPTKKRNSRNSGTKRNY